MEAKTKSPRLEPQTIHGHHGMPKQHTVAREWAYMQPQAFGVVTTTAFEH